MQNAYWTTTGERPDLASIEVNPPEGFIGTKIFPIVPVTEKSGYLYYATVQADAAAQTGRSAGVAPTATTISDSNTTFTCAEACKRAQITPDEVKTYGSLAKAEEVAAKWAKRQVQRAHEAAAVTVLLHDTADTSYDAATFQKQVQVALDAMHSYEGRTALVGARSLLKLIAGNSNINTALLRIVTGVEPKVASVGLSWEQQKAALAIWLGLDDILDGDSGLWTSGAASGKVAVVKYDASGDPLSHKYMPILGKTMQYVPDGADTSYVIRSTPDYVNVVNLFDAYQWYQIKELNSTAFYVFGSVS